MSRKINIETLKSNSVKNLDSSITRLDTAIQKKYDYHLVRWMSAMTAVEMHGIWERYVEKRLVASLNHSATHFIAEQDIKGIKHISSGLALYIVRGGGKFFDFRSMSDLLKKADEWVGRDSNPFRGLPATHRDYIDTLSALRNCIVHGSDASVASYRRYLKKVYEIKSTPAPDEFLNAIDYRVRSPCRYQSRIKGLAKVLADSIQRA